MNGHGWQLARGNSAEPVRDGAEKTLRFCVAMSSGASHLTDSAMKLASVLATTLCLLSAHSAASGRVLRDDFSNPGSGWPNFAAARSSDLGFAVYQDGGGYQLTPVQDGVFGFIAAPKQAQSNNVKIEADVFVYAGIGAGAGGVVCRFQDNNNFYGFIGLGDASVAIVKIEDGKASTLARTAIQSVMPGAVDTRFTVRCEGPRLTLEASGATRLSVEDSSLRSGKTGLLVIGEKLAGTSVSYKEFILEDLGE